MAGHLRKRGPDSWQLIVYGGAGRYVTRTHRGSRRDAEKALARLVTEVADKKQRPARGRTVADLFDQWGETASVGWSPSTAAVDLNRIERKIIPALGRLRVNQVGPHDLERFYAQLRREGLKPSTVQRYHNIIRNAFGQAVRWGWIGVNPATLAMRPKADRAEIIPPSPELVRRLLAAADGPMLTFLMLEVSTGARRGQLIALRWTDVDLDSGIVRFVNTAVKGPTGQEVRPLNRTKGRRRTVAIDPATAHTLSVHRDEMTARAELFGTRLPADAFVFSDEPDSTRPWLLDTFTQRFVKLRKTVGADTVRFHDLRHYVATQLVAAGIDARAVAERLGHARPSTTLDMYAGVVSDRDIKAASILAAILKGTSDPADT